MGARVGRDRGILFHHHRADRAPVHLLLWVLGDPLLTLLDRRPLVSIVDRRGTFGPIALSFGLSLSLGLLHHHVLRLRGLALSVAGLATSLGIVRREGFHIVSRARSSSLGVDRVSVSSRGAHRVSRTTVRLPQFRCHGVTGGRVRPHRFRQFRVEPTPLLQPHHLHLPSLLLRRQRLLL